MMQLFYTKVLSEMVCRPITSITFTKIGIDYFYIPKGQLRFHTKSQLSLNFFQKREKVARNIAVRKTVFIYETIR